MITKIKNLAWIIDPQYPVNIHIANFLFQGDWEEGDNLSFLREAVKRTPTPKWYTYGLRNLRTGVVVDEEELIEISPIERWEQIGTKLPSALERGDCFSLHNTTRPYFKVKAIYEDGTADIQRIPRNKVDYNQKLEMEFPIFIYKELRP